MNSKLPLIMTMVLLGVCAAFAKPSQKGKELLNHLELSSDEVVVQSSNSVADEGTRNMKREPRKRCPPGHINCYLG